MEIEVWKGQKLGAKFQFFLFLSIRKEYLTSWEHHETWCSQTTCSYDHPCWISSPFLKVDTSFKAKKLPDTSKKWNFSHLDPLQPLFLFKCEIWSIPTYPRNFLPIFASFHTIHSRKWPKIAILGHFWCLYFFGTLEFPKKLLIVIEGLRLAKLVQFCYFVENHFPQKIAKWTENRKHQWNCSISKINRTSKSVQIASNLFQSHR